MSLFKKRTQKRAGNAGAPASETESLAKLSAKVSAKWSTESSDKVATQPEAEPSVESPPEPSVKFSAALAARLSGEPSVSAEVKPSVKPSVKFDIEPSTENFHGLSWEIWYVEFKTVATLGNPRLQLQGADENIIDLMDHQPLKEAFDRAVDPTQLGEQFAADFDVGTFLRDNGVFK
tara:strand:+ start:1339 stop:1869 length:531 start_codon:yes stop_codon:yes gene_type:complete